MHATILGLLILQFVFAFKEKAEYFKMKGLRKRQWVSNGYGIQTDEQ